MTTKRMAITLAAAILVFSPGIHNRLAGEDRRMIRPLKTISIAGEVLIVHSEKFVISPYFNIQMDGKPVSRMDVSLEGRGLRETMPGQYAGIRITDLIPVAGNQLHFLIRSPKHIVIPPEPDRSIEVAGVATIGSLAAITQPPSGSSYSPADLGRSLDVEWILGTPAFRLGVVKATGGAFLEVFSRSDILARTFSLPSILFQPANQYTIDVSCTMGSFAMTMEGKDATVAVDKSSAVRLNYSVLSSISIMGSPDKGPLKK